MNILGDCESKLSSEEKGYVIKCAREVLLDNEYVRDRHTLSYDVISLIFSREIPYDILWEMVPNEVDSIIMGECGEGKVFYREMVKCKEWPNDFIVLNEE